MNIEQLKELIAKLQGEIADVKSGDRTADGVEKLTKLRADLAKARTELTTAEAEAKAIEDAFADAEGDADDPEAVNEPDEPGRSAEDVNKDNPSPTPATPSPVVEPGVDDAGAKKDEENVAPDGTPVTLAASAAAASPTAHAAASVAIAPMVLTASGSAVGAGIAPGGALDRDGMAAVLTAAASAAVVESGMNRFMSISRFGDSIDKAATLGRHNTEIENTRLIAKARADYAASKGAGNGPVSLTAAGCFCGPDDLIRETGVVGRRGRPFAGMFPNIAIRGGFRAMPDLAFNVDTGLRSGVTQWTCADQTAVDPNDPDTLKPCAELACFTEQTYTPYAVVACIEAERYHEWAHPEQIDAWINLLGIEYDALAETLLIDQIETEAGTPLTIGAAGGLMEDHGLVAQLIYALSSLAYPLGYQFREGAGVLNGYTLSVPVGMAEALYADERMRGFPSGVKSKEQIVSEIEAGTGVRMVERLDESTSRKAAAAATVTAMNAGGAIDGATTPLLPPTFRMYLIPLEGYVHGEGTLVEAAWHVDTRMLEQNRMRYFWENVEILANLSVRKPHIIDIPGEIVGAYTDLVAGPGNA